MLKSKYDIVLPNIYSPNFTNYEIKIYSNPSLGRKCADAEHTPTTKLQNAKREKEAPAYNLCYGTELKNISQSNPKANQPSSNKIHMQNQVQEPKKLAEKIFQKKQPEKHLDKQNKKPFKNAKILASIRTNRNIQF